MQFCGTHPHPHGWRCTEIGRILPWVVYLPSSRRRKRGFSKSSCTQLEMERVHVLTFDGPYVACHSFRDDVSVAPDVKVQPRSSCLTNLAQLLTKVPRWFLCVPSPKLSQILVKVDLGNCAECNASPLLVKGGPASSQSSMWVLAWRSFGSLVCCEIWVCGALRWSVCHSCFSGVGDARLVQSLVPCCKSFNYRMQRSMNFQLLSSKCVALRLFRRADQCRASL